jgi:hypothetical protein
MRLRIWFSAVAAVVLTVASTAAACDTPVYRYALYNWQPTPYHIYYFYQGAIAKADQETNRRIEELGGLSQADEGRDPADDFQPAPPISDRHVEPGNRANITLRKVDVDKKDQIDRVPEVVRKAWEGEGRKAVPTYVVFTAWRMSIHIGPLDRAAVDQMADSPVRKKIAGLLDEGNSGVFLCMSGKTPPEKEAIEKTVRQVIADAEAGKLSDEEPAEVPEVNKKTAPPAAGDPADAPKKPTKIKLAMVPLDRADAAEKWLVRSLATVEQDVPEVAGQAMVFMVFGRGRALPPCIGKGITAENLARDVALLTGPCSCMVKEQNPGVDLLFTWDWEATSERLARAEGEASGTPETRPRGRAAMDSVGELPREVSPAKPDGAEKDPIATKSATPSSSPAEAVQPLKATDPPTAAPASTQAEAPVAASASAAAEAESEAYSSRLLWRLGVGMAIAAAVVLAAGLFVVRRQ